ncbi:MAG: hypothetical protein A3I44_00850 [Candidatus Sungbacteria bacterium RIFCSPLOWO2_02_FULL_51_17]|nr:MAG: hypothetical protein A2676_05735 [Candidatus Sungbacteria bacterium RIFCSPHIGHO2_01_FULL_51_22]OHA10669.1 MAG: hypothetical protein A3I44_00850 [Candidatus Sungbacteria bacterium RIFCSPLOWO2_02_FULL_51_17]
MGQKMAFAYMVLVSVGLLTILLWGSVVRAATAPEFDITITPSQVVTPNTSVIFQVVPKNFFSASTTFSWFVGTKSSPALSGVGKSSYTFKTTGFLGAFPITVRVAPEGLALGERVSGVIVMPDDTITDGPAIPGGGLDFGSVKSNFTITAVPQNPHAGESVELSIETFAFDSRSARFTWRVDGKTQKDASGLGKTDYSFVAGAAGTTHSVRVDVVTPEGIANSKTLTVPVVDLAFYWWSNTSIPLWYKGKALPTKGSSVSVMALTNGQPISAYNWSINNNPSFKSTLRVFTYVPQLTGLRDNISLEILNSAKNLKKERGVTIVPTEMAVHIYATGPLEGTVFTEALSAFTGSSHSSYDLIAEPFFFIEGSPKDLAYVWTVGDKTVTEETDREKKRVLTVKTEDPTSGPVIASVRVESTSPRSAPITVPFSIGVRN